MTALAPLVPVAQAEYVTDAGGQPHNRLTLACGHVVIRRAYMGGTYARARCTECRDAAA